MNNKSHKKPIKVISVVLAILLLLTVTLAAPAAAYSADGVKGSGRMEVKMSATEVQKWFDSKTSRGLLDIDLIAYDMSRQIGVTVAAIRTLSYMFSLHIKSTPKLKTQGHTFIYQN